MEALFCPGGKSSFLPRVACTIARQAVYFLQENCGCPPEVQAPPNRTDREGCSIKRLKQWLLQLLFPGTPWVILWVLLGTGSLVLTFGEGLQDTPFGYASYLLSACGLTVLVAALVRGLPHLGRRVKARPLAGRLIHDEYFRVRAGLFVTFAVNAGYALLRIVSAVLFSSFWYGVLGLYYLLLCAVRLFLARRMSPAMPHSRQAELKVLRTTGGFLLAVNLALLGIARQILVDGRSYDYPGYLIYAAAAFSFYSLTMAVINTVRFRRFESPLLAAAQSVSTTTALVSLFSLETAMLARFGTDPTLDHQMLLWSGPVICTVALAQSVIVFVRAWVKLRRESPH